MENSTTTENSAELDQLITQLNQLNTVVYVQLGCLVVSIYHIMIGFEKEVRLVWSKRINFAAILYFWARYPTPIVYMLFLMILLWPPAATDVGVCNALSNTLSAMEILYLIGIGGIFSIRAYAISRAKRLVFIPLGVAFLASIILEIVLTCMFPGCSFAGSTNGKWLTGYASWIIVSVAQQVAATAGHAVIFAITVYELWDIVRKKSRRYLASHLSVILLKQGFLRFLFGITVGVVQEVITVSTPTNSPGSEISGSITFLLSSIIASDFFLSLRHYNEFTVTRIEHNLDWAAPPPREYRSSPRSFFQSASDYIVAEMSTVGGLFLEGESGGGNDEMVYDLSAPPGSRQVLSHAEDASSLRLDPDGDS